MEIKKINEKMKKINLEILTLEEKKEKLEIKISEKQKERKEMENLLAEKISAVVTKTYGEITEETMQRFEKIMNEEEKNIQEKRQADVV